VYHVTNRGNNKKAIFRIDQDRETFLNILAQVNKRYHWLCHAYCLMDNHYHLLAETPDGNLSLGMRQLNGVYTQTYNKKRATTGHIFQGRYKAVLIQKDSHLLEVCRYVVLNPLRARMVEKPGEWKWSSYNATAGLETSHPCLAKEWILEQFGRTRTVAEKEYRKFITLGITEGTIWNKVKGQTILGEEDFVDSLSDHLKRHKDIPEIPKSQRYANRPELAKIFSEGILADIDKRNNKIAEAVEKYGYTQRAIADYLGIHFTYVSRILCGHYKR
jgi:REP element-mobilizing transposase RayT